MSKGVSRSGRGQVSARRLQAERVRGIDKLQLAVNSAVERLEDRRLLSVAQSWVNDNWSFAFDTDGSSSLTVGDLVSDPGNGISPNVRTWGVNAFGTISSGAYQTNPPALTGPAPTTINAAIGETDAGGTVTILAGSYDQTVLLNKALNLQGPNAGVAGTGTRVAEAVINAPAGVISDPNQAMIEVDAAGATLRGLTIDGGSVGSAASRGIRVNGQSNVQVTNNIIQDVAGRSIQYNGATAGNSGGLVQGNLISNATPGALGEGYGVLAFDSSYVSITGNTMSNVDVGIFEQYFYQPNAGNAVNTISGNTITANTLGYGTNERAEAASAVSLTNNTITVAAGGTGVQLYNIYKANGVQLSGNTLSGGDTGIYAFVNGGSVSVSGGSVSNATTGVQLTNYLADFTAPATAAGSLSLAGVALNNNATGILVEGNTSSTSDVSLGLSGGTSVTGGTTGLRLQGAQAKLAGDSLGDAAFSGQSSQHVELAAGALDNVTADATAATFAGETGTAKDSAENYATEDKITHATDDASVGFIRVKASNVFVTPTSGSIQRGVDAAAALDTVNVDAGNFIEQVSINKDLTLAGSGESATTVQSPAAGVAPSFTYAGSTKQAIIGVESANVTIQDLAVNGDGKGATVVPGNDFVGIGTHNGSVTIDSVAVTGIRDASYNGIQRGRAIFISNDSGNPVTATVTDSTIGDYQKNGIDVRGNNVTATITDNVITGQSGTNVNGQNGIVLLGGVSGTVSGNTISGNTYAPANFDGTTTGATGILLYNAGAVAVSDNTLTGNDIGVDNFHSAGVAVASTVSGNTLDNKIDLVLEAGSSTTIGAGNSFSGDNFYIRNNTDADYNLTSGSAFEATDNFRIEDKMYHQLDNAASGLIRVVADNVYVTAPGTGLSDESIQRGVDAASAGDTVNIEAGSYTETVSVNKDISLVGAGSGSTTLTNAAAAQSGVPALTIGASASGLSVTGLKVQVNQTYGISIPSGSLANLAFDDVAINGTDNALLNFGEFEIGFYISPTTSVNGLSFSNSTFSHLLYGYVDNKEIVAPDTSIVTNVTFNNSIFQDNVSKGLYSEKLDNATFNNVQFLRNGFFGGWYQSNVVAGADINLKDGAYNNIEFNNSTFTDNGVFTVGAGLDANGVADNGAGLTIKARDDAPSYSGRPATLNGVEVNGGAFTGNRAGIRMGEFGKANLGPVGAVIDGAAITGSQDAGIILTGGNTTVRNADFTGGTDNPVDIRIGAGAQTTTLGDNLKFAASTYYIENRDTQDFDLSGNAGITFDEASNFAIEQKIFHQVDDASVGLVTWVDNTLFVAPTAAPTATDNDYTRIANALSGAANGFTIQLGATGADSTFNWDEPFAMASWALGNDAVAGTDDDWSANLPAGLSDLTITAAVGDNVTIQGPGDLASTNIDTGIAAYNTGVHTNVEISNFKIAGISNAIGIYYTGGADFSGLKIDNMHIVVPADVQETTSPFHNIGIHYALGQNISITNNTIEFEGNGAGPDATSVGIQSNTHGGAGYDGLNISGNTFAVLNDGTEEITGLWENGHAHQSDITVSNNTFTNATTNPNTTAFTITSHSSGTTDVTYSGNTVTGANIGFEWLATYAGNPGDFSVATGPVKLDGNTVKGTNTAVDIGGTNAQASLTNNDFDDASADNQTDVRIQAGSGAVAFGTGNQFGGEQLFIRNEDDQAISLAGYGAANFEGETNNFRIEDKIFHKMDDVSVGRVTWTPTGVFVTTPGVGSTDSSIQRGIDIAASGETVNIEDGVYSETLTVNKALTLDGQTQGGVTLQPAATPNVTLITVAPAVTTDDVTIRDINFQGLNGSVIADYGVRVPATAVMDTLTVERSNFTGFRLNGLAVFGAGNDSGGTGLSAQSVVIDTAVFDANGAGAVGGAGAINLFYYNGNATFQNVDITNELANPTALPNSYRGGIQMRGVGAASGANILPMGNVVFNDVDITGDYRNYMITLQRYGTATATFTDVALGGATSSLFGGFGAALRFDAVGAGTLASPATVDLGNTHFRGLTGANAYTQVFDLEFAPDNSHAFLKADGDATQWNGLGAASGFDDADYFAVEDRVLHFLDQNHPTHGTFKGLLELQAGTVYITPTASIQRGVDVAPVGGTVKLNTGTYSGVGNRDVDVYKDVTITGQGASTLVDATGGADGFKINSSGVTLSDLAVANAAGAGIQFATAVDDVDLNAVSVSGSNYGVNVANAAAVTNLTLDNVSLTANQVGFRVSTTGTVQGLDIVNGSISNNQFGIYNDIASGSTGNTSAFTDISVSGTSFTGNLQRALYLEKLDNATFSNVTLSGNTATTIADINLKGGNYSNITFTGGTYSNAGTGSVLYIKARNDAPSYNGNPASLTGLSVTGVTLSSTAVSPTSFGSGLVLENNVQNPTLSGITFAGTGNGVLLSLLPSQTIDLGNSSFAGTLGNYVVNATPHAVDGADASYAGITGNSATTSEAFDIVDKIVDGVDVGGLGLVSVRAGDVFVTPNSFTPALGTTAPSIQRGVNVATAGDEVYAEAGTYTEHVVVNKALTIKGAQAGVDARNRAAVPESVLTGSGFSLQANGITLDGFTVSGVDTPTQGVGVLLSSASSGYQIVNNIFRDNIFGLYLNSSGANATLVQNNWFDNNNRPGSASGNGIYTDQGASNVDVVANLFTNQSSASMVFAGTQSNLDITDNDINGGNSIVLFNTTGANVLRNVITAPGGSGIFVSGSTGIDIGENEVTGMSSGVSLSSAGGASTNVTIHNNKFHSNQFGVSVSAGGFTGELEVHNNSIDGNTTAGLRNNSTATVDAESNYWGDSTGPSPVALNPLSNGQGDAVTGTGAASVDFAPFLTDGTDTLPAARGFQPNAVDATPPATPAAPDLTTDTGTNTTDNITKNNLPTFAGTVEADATIRLYADGNLIGTGIADGAGVYAITSTVTLADGIHAITVDATDAAGNVSSMSGALSVTIDATAPGAIVTTVPPTPVNEGTSVAISAAVSDSGSGVESTTYTVSDGTNVVASGSGASFNFTPPDQGAYTISFVVTDVAGNVTTTSDTLTVNNVAPTITGLGATPNSISEGASVSLTGTVTEPGVDLVDLTIDWGDNSPTTTVIGVAPGTDLSTLNLTHTYVDDNPTGTSSDAYTISVTATDNEATPNTSVTTTSVTVANVAPTITVSGPTTADEGALVTVNAGAIVDPGTGETFTYTWSVTGPNGFTAGTTGSGAPTSFQFTPPDEGSYVVTLTVNDDDLGSGSDSLTVAVGNAAPVYTPAANQSTTEGASTVFSLGSFTDAGAGDTPWTVSIDWGDGSPASVYTVATPGDLDTLLTPAQRTHSYADEGDGDYTVVVTITDADNASDSDGFEVAVTNVAPALVLNPVATIDENGVATLSGTYSDPGAGDTHSITIDWGDGSSPQTLAVTGGAFSFTHQYLDDKATGPDTYTISATLTDNDTGSDVETVDVAVSNVAPVLTLGAVTAISEGGTASLSGTYSDVGTQDTHSILVDWGDGTTPQTIAVIGGAFSATHQYVDDNPTGTPSDAYTITVTLSDDDGGIDTETTSVTVNNVAPSITISGPTTGIENTAVTFTAGTLVDPGTADSFSYTWTVTGPHGYVNNTPGTGAPTTFNFTPPDDGAYSVSLTVNDDDGGTFTTPAETFTVADVDPTVVIDSLTSAIDENTAATLSFHLADPGNGDLAATSQVAINWGDGSAPTVINSSTNPTALTTLRAGGSVTLTHTYADDATASTSSDNYTISFNSAQSADAPEPARSYNPMTVVGSAVVTVNNLAPTGDFLLASPSTVPAGTSVSVNWVDQADAPADVAEGLRYTYRVNGALLIPAASFGDGTYTGGAGSSAVTIPGSYFNTPGTYTIESEIRDNDGGVTTKSVTLTVGAVSFRVSSVTPNASGFDITFNRAFNQTPVNLYANDTTTPADVVVTRNGSPVRGSLIFSGGNVATFVQTGGVLLDGTYAITIRSGDTGFEDTAGEDLDGNNDGTTGDNYVATGINITQAGPRVVSLPDFTRGPGQSVEVPSTATVTPGQQNPPSLPIRVNGGADVTSIDFLLDYDTALLQLGTPSNVDPEKPFVDLFTLPAGWTVDFSFTSLGGTRVRVDVAAQGPAVSTPNALNNLLIVKATVPAGATYGASQAIRLSEVEVNGSDGLADLAVHEYAYLGDANGNKSYSAQDVQLIQRVAANLATGFSVFTAYRNIDPIVLADVNNTNSVTAQDANVVSQEAAGFDTPLIPPLPVPPVAIVAQPTSTSRTSVSEEVLGTSVGQTVTQTLLFSDTQIRKG